MGDDFDEIYRRHADAVLRFTWRLVGRREIAEELVAETFVSLLEHFETVRVAELPAWLFTVARHRAMDYWRRRAVEERYAGSLPSEPEAPPADEGAGWRLLDTPGLKPIHRLCMRLRYGYGMSVKEVADAVGLSEIQVKGHLQQARKVLRAAVGRETA